MRLKNKKMLLVAAIILLLAAVVGIVIFDRDSENDFEKKLELAGEYLNSSDYDNAIAIYNGIIAEDDSCSEAYVGLAEAYYTKGNTEKALNVLEKGLEYSADEDVVIEQIKTFFPGYDFESFGYEDDEYYAEVPDEIGLDAETDYEAIASETEITDVAEETTVTETTVVPDTEETTSTTTSEITTTAAPTVTTAATTTTVPITTTAAPVTTTTAPRTTTTVTTTTTTVATTKEPEAVVVDDLTMMTVSEARAWCKSNNLSLSVIGGDGEIISQSPAPGSIIEEYSEIIVRCE